MLRGHDSEEYDNCYQIMFRDDLINIKIHNTQAFNPRQHLQMSLETVFIQEEGRRFIIDNVFSVLAEGGK